MVNLRDFQLSEFLELIVIGLWLIVIPILNVNFSMEKASGQKAGFTGYLAGTHLFGFNCEVILGISINASHSPEFYRGPIVYSFLKRQNADLQ